MITRDCHELKPIMMCDPSVGEFVDFTRRVLGLAKIDGEVLLFGIVNGPIVEVGRSLASKLAYAIRRATDYEVEESSIKIGEVAIKVIPSTMDGVECFWVSLNGIRMHLSREQMDGLAMFLDEMVDHGPYSIGSVPDGLLYAATTSAEVTSQVLSDYQVTS